MLFLSLFVRAVSALPALTSYTSLSGTELESPNVAIASTLAAQANESSMLTNETGLYTFWRSSKAKDFEPLVNKTIVAARNVTRRLQDWTEDDGYRLYYPIQVQIGYLSGNVTSLAEVASDVAKITEAGHLVTLYRELDEFLKAMDEKVQPIFNVGGDYATDNILRQLDKSMVKLTVDVIKGTRENPAAQQLLQPVLERLAKSYTKTNKLTSITAVPFPLITTKSPGKSPAKKEDE